MRIYKYEIGTKLTGEVAGENSEDAMRNLKGLREEIKNLLRKLGVGMVEVWLLWLVPII